TGTEPAARPPPACADTANAHSDANAACADTNTDAHSDANAACADTNTDAHSDANAADTDADAASSDADTATDAHTGAAAGPSARRLLGTNIRAIGSLSGGHVHCERQDHLGERLDRRREAR